MASTIRYVNRSSKPTERHYKYSEYPLGSSIARTEAIKYQTVVRLDGYVWDRDKQRWKRASRRVTICHQQMLKRKEIEQLAEESCKKTSEDFRVKKVVLVDARKSPTYRPEAEAA